jgi:hypothetical protein
MFFIYKVKNVSAIHEIKIKTIDNLICGSIGCDNLAKRKITFHLGFLAGFCDYCAKDLIKDELGFEDVESMKNGQTLGVVVEPETNASGMIWPSKGES